MKNISFRLISKKLSQKLILVFLSILMLAGSAWVGGEHPSMVLPVQGEDTLFYSNQIGDNLEDIYASAILKSQKSILLLIFSLTNKNIIDAIRQKSEEGITIKVICDAKASPNIIQKLGPKVDVLRRFGKGLMHLKILVVDDHECWIGSANMTGESLHMHGNLVLAMSHPELASTIQKKANSLQEYDREGNIDPVIYQIGHQKVELSFLPDDSKGCKRIKDLIRSAQKTIQVAMYTFTRYDLAKELVAARNRGVEVDIVLDRHSSKGASAKIAALLEGEEMSIAYSTGSALLHHKFMLIDDKILEVGSANWTKAAFTINDDCFLVLYDLTADQQNQMKHLWKIIKSESTR